MAMFSTYFAWKLIDLGWPYWLAFVVTVVVSFVGGVAIERLVVQAVRQRADPRLRHRLHRARSHLQRARRLALRLFRHRASTRPFTGRPWFGSGYMSAHESGAIAGDLVRAGAGLRVLPLHPARPRDARGGAEPGVEPAGRHPRRLDAGDRLGPGGGDRRGRRHDGGADRLSRSQHDGRRPALRLRRRGARRHRQSVRRRRSAASRSACSRTSSAPMSSAPRSSCRSRWRSSSPCWSWRPSGLFGRRIVARV